MLRAIGGVVLFVVGLWAGSCWERDRRAPSTGPRLRPRRAPSRDPGTLLEVPGLRCEDLHAQLFGALALILALSGSSACTITTMITGREKRETYELDPLASKSRIPPSAAPPRLSAVRWSAATRPRCSRTATRSSPRWPGDPAGEEEREPGDLHFPAGRAGRLFADALIAAANNGVEVRLLVDAWGSEVGELRDRSSTTRVSMARVPPGASPLDPQDRTAHAPQDPGGGRPHRLHGRPRNRRAWLGNARNTKEWRDTQVRVEGPVVAQMQAIFSEDWTFTTGEILARARSTTPRIEPAGSTLAQAVKASLGDATSLSKMLYYVAIESATRSIYIQNAYFLPDKQVRQALVDAAKRGVDVQIMVPGRNIDLPMVRQASWSHYGELLEAGVHIWEYEPTMLHNKTMVVDGIYSTVGSINFSARSMSKNAEESLAFYDKDFARKMEAMFQKDRARCDEITYAEWKHRGFTKRLSETVFWAFEPYY